ncbi:MAG: MATE family efflux transporter [Lachnospiraceae bacterium]|nr:MATE family efflux transporter [Lachnospiraceae bacterium]
MSKENVKNKQLILNMAASLLSTLVALGISFFITPTVIGKFGAEAQGFVTMATNFVNYAAIAAMALNSMAGRFITVELAKGNQESANRYFNSVMYANLGIVAVLLLPAALVVLYLDRLVNISPALTGDVKLLFALMFLNFFVTIVSTTFSTATFAANRLDLQALRTIESQLLKALVLVAMFALLPVRVCYIGAATLLSNLYLFLAYIHYTKKLMPGIHVSYKSFSTKTVMQILSAGIWNTVMRTGQVLTNQLDTLIANLWIGKDESGYIGTSTTIVTAVNTLYETVSAVFTPSLTISFAKEDKKEMIDDLKSAMRLTGFFANIPLCYIIGFGMAFYTLWLPSEKAIIPIYYYLTIFIMLGTLVGGAISPLFNVYTIVNKLKWNSIVTLIMGVMNAVIVFILLQFPTLQPYGIYFIAGISSILGIIKNMTFTPMYAAHCLGISKKTFYPTIFRYIFVTVIMSVCFLFLGKVFPADTWLMIFLSVVTCGILGSVLNFFLLFEKKEKDLLWQTLSKVFRR